MSTASATGDASSARIKLLTINGVSIQLSLVISLYVKILCDENFDLAQAFLLLYTGENAA